MKEIWLGFPLWFSMIIVLLIVMAIIYRFTRFGVKIKAGPIEIDTTDEEVKDGK